MKKFTSLLIVLALTFTFAAPASAKTVAAGQTVGNVLFTITNKNGEEILVSQVSVAEMEADMKAGKVDTTLHNYSLLDRFVTTVHQEAQGFTVQEFVDYATQKSPVASLKSLRLSFSGASQIRFWEIDQTGFDDLDTYTYADLYGTERYNFPALYEYWDYETQQYKDVDAIWASRQKETVILSVRAFSQRYMVTSEKFGVDYNMEGYWQGQGLLDNERTLRVMKPMSKDELYSKTPTAADSRYWVANICLVPENAPDIEPLGKVAAPKATMTEDSENYYISFTSDTPGATILYNHNFISPSYTPTAPYDGEAVVVPKTAFPSGTVTMTARAVKEGYTDAGVVTLKLTAGGSLPSDVKDGAWYLGAASYVMGAGLFDLIDGKFAPDAPMTREMMVTALTRLGGDASKITDGTNPQGSITREQIATMLHRFAGLPAASADLSIFSDADKISDWAHDAVIWAVGVKIINGMGDGTVAPQGTATRAQVAQILLNYKG